MEYFGGLNLLSIPFSFVERRVYDGQEELMFCVPLKRARIQHDKRGRFLLRFYAVNPTDEKLKARGCTHQLMLAAQRNIKEELKATGDYRINNAGSLIPYLYGEIPRNQGRDVRIEGVLDYDLMCDEKTIKECCPDGNRLPCIFRTRYGSEKPMFCKGFLFVREILNSSIKVNPETGKKYIPCVFRKMLEVDNQKNSHEVVFVRPNGTEVQIGVFREYLPTGGLVNERTANTNLALDAERELKNNEVDTIDGLDF